MKSILIPPLLAVWLQVRVLSEPTTKSIAVQSPVCGRGGLSPQVRFTNSRWLKPIDRFREDLYLYSPKGAQYTADGLRARWGRWLADTPEGRVICRRWKEWVGAQVKKYDWDIDPDDADHPTIHGLRGTGILARAEQGYEVDQIANDIGMSRQNVEHYMRFRDQMKVGADGQKRLRLVTRRLEPQRKTRPRTQARLYGPCKSPGLQNSWP